MLLTLGGSDVKSLSPQLIGFIRKSFPSYCIVVLIGPGCTCIKEIRAAADEKVRLVVNPSDEEISRAMATSDLAIATGGHTMYELAAAGLPTVQVQVAENQEVSKYWEDFGFSRFAGWYDNQHFLTRLKECIGFYASPEKREKSSTLGQGLIDGCGAERLIQEIMQKTCG
jgi:spore coat polysaccharide biosynthesis predicted glycosyltransferase SpsG